MADKKSILDYTKVRPNVSSGGCGRTALRTHDNVFVRTRSVPNFADMKSRCEAEGKNGGAWLRDQIADMAARREALNLRRRNGEACQDSEAEALSFGAVHDIVALRKALDFDVTFDHRSNDGLSCRSVTTSAFALLASSMAVQDATMAFESVPTVAELLVQDMDDIQPHTELPQVLDFGMVNPDQDPKPLGETEEYREIGVGEDRYTVLSFKDGYQRAFSQDAIDLGGPKVFSQITDLGQGAREVMELFSLRKIIDYNGSKATGAGSHVMIRNRAAASLFSATANTPSTRTPSGTRINNNALVDTDNLETLRIRLASVRNPAGYPVANFPEVILVPDALWAAAWKMLNSTLQPGVENEANFFGPGSPGGRIKLISTPMLDLLTTTHWYGGRPQRQFVRKFKMRPEIATFGGKGTEAYLRTREGFRVRIGWDMTIGVRDHIWWIENSDDTAGPAD